MTQTLPKRTDIAIEHTWDATCIFTDDTAWEEEITYLSEKTPTLTEFKDKLSQSPQKLAQWFEEVYDLVKRATHAAIYAHMFSVVDTSNQEASARVSRAFALFSQLQAAAAFAEPELLTMPAETLQRWIVEEPSLSIYAHYFDQLKKRVKHVRSAEVEALLGNLSQVFTTAMRTASVLTDTDFKFSPAIDAHEQTYEVAQSTIDGLVTHEDREVRKTAWENYCDTYVAYKNTLANCLTASIQRDVFMARTRNYNSCLDHVLSSSHIPLSVYHNTIDTFKKNLPVWHRYWRARRKALGYNKLYEYDIKAPLTLNKPTVSYEQAVDWITEGMRPLGNEYAEQLRRGCLEERWIDIYPNQDKSSGAFSTGYLGTHPYIFMSYTDDLFSMSTLAHELGHSMHSYYTWQNQPLVYSNYSLFVAEVASNFNQALTRAYLFENNVDSDFQMALLEEAFSNFHRYFFIMPTLARFELETHTLVEQGKPLTSDILCNLMADLFTEGYGDELEIDRERAGITWATFGHLYSRYYTYQYTTGISAAHSLATAILDGNQKAVDNYLTFLKAGNSIYPIDALKLAGVDMTSPEPVETTFAVLEKLVTRLEDLVDAH